MSDSSMVREASADEGGKGEPGGGGSRRCGVNLPDGGVKMEWVAASTRSSRKCSARRVCVPGSLPRPSMGGEGSSVGENSSGESASGEVKEATAARSA